MAPTSLLRPLKSTNDTPATDWQDRNLTTRFNYTNDKGVPYESIAKLANTLNKDLWINVPYHASEDYVRQMARFFRVRYPKTVVVFVTRAFSQTELFEAARVGAAAYLRASTDADLFAATLRRAAAGQFPIDEEVVRFPAVAARILAQFREESVAEAAPAPAPEAAPPKAEEAELGPLFVKLSPREIEILDLVARGNSNKIIGRKLSISDQTVKNHVSAILRKLEVNDRTEAVVYALRNGWIRIETPAS